MTDHWEMYPTTIDGQSAYILYDHGLRETINELPLPMCFHVIFSFKTPSAEGLPSRQEFEQLVALEDGLEEVLNTFGAVYVGRATANGERRMLFYTNADQAALMQQADAVGGQHGYALDYRFLDEPGKEGYWEYLYPTAEEWRVILDMKVLRQLEQHHDDSAVPRDIDHYSCFAAETDAHRFAKQIVEHGFTLCEVSPPQADKRAEWQVHVTKHSPALPECIHEQTAMLLKVAQDCSGDYDGWGCGIVKKPEPEPAPAPVDGGFDPLK